MQKINFYLKLINYAPLIILGLLVLILVIGGAFLFPKFGQLSDVKEKIQNKELELQYTVDYFKKLEDSKVKLEEKKSEISKISSTLPSDPSMPSIFKFIQETASFSGVILSDINPFKTELVEGSNTIKETSFVVGLVGSYSSFKEFLITLENSARLFEVRNLSIGPDQETDALKFNLSLIIYSY